MFHSRLIGHIFIKPVFNFGSYPYFYKGFVNKM